MFWGLWAEPLLWGRSLRATVSGLPERDLGHTAPWKDSSGVRGRKGVWEVSGRLQLGRGGEQPGPGRGAGHRGERGLTVSVSHLKMPAAGWSHPRMALHALPARLPWLVGLCSVIVRGGEWRPGLSLAPLPDCSWQLPPRPPPPVLPRCLLPLRGPLSNVWKPFPGRRRAGQS